MHNIRNKISNTHRNSFRTVSQMSGAFTLLLMLTAYANGSALSSGQQASGFRTVEQLPVDRFDEYEAGKLPPHPWRLIGAEPGMLPKGIELALLADGESLFPGNKITGKGLVFRTKSMTEGTHGVGIATSFVPPPEGDVYLGFDFRFLRPSADEEAVDATMSMGMELACDLTDENGRGLQLRLNREEGLRMLAAEAGDKGVNEWKKIAPLSYDLWFHVGVTVSADNRVSFVLFTERDKKKPVGLGLESLRLPDAGALSELRFYNASGDARRGGWAVDNVCMGGQVDADRAEWLPFRQESASVMRAEKRKVFAYYYPIYSSEWSSADPGLSWYVRTTLNASTEVDPRRKNAGTKIFYHPLPRPPMAAGLSKEEELIRAMEEEVRLGIQMGLDGFVVDFFSYPKSSTEVFNRRSFALVEAARRVDSGFKIIPAPYTTTNKNGVNGEGDPDTDPAYYAQSPVFRHLWEAPAVLRTEDGRMVFSMWLPERHSTGWWQAALAEMERLGMRVAFLPQFNSTGRLAEFAPISLGMANWGPRSPIRTNWVETARKHTALVVAPVAPHDIRSRGSIFWEAANFSAQRRMWQTAIEDQAEWVFINTWSDFSEQAMAPATAIGFAPYDIAAYYTQWFKTGRQPEITRDVLYYSYRRHHSDLKPARGIKWTLKQEGGGHAAVRDEIELLGFLLEPGELRIVINGEMHTRQAEAGITSFKVPLPVADKVLVPEFSLTRGGRTVVSGSGRYAVLNKIEYPNMLYHSGVLVGEGPQPPKNSTFDFQP
ncbi:hypothetical protein Ga0100231_003490 [Opitutaceae bacterium TAV4]|nr:hypothetical protein Ga0100231_003490 [Opitutaceae bacterium TAV4]RRK01962.1 hypothetical protein Ga0100230_001715 [Opitutaceae bacterium TAV3]